MGISVALLRGMNLGRRRIKNDALRAAFEGLGFGSVSTFRASGNVLFEDEGATEAALRDRIEQGLEAALGYPVPTFLRSAAELKAITDFAPFSDEELRASTGKVQITMYAAAASAESRAAVLALATEKDRLAFGSRELYWLPRAGTQESELDHRTIAQLLGDGTTRTIGTMQSLAGKAGA